MLTSSPSPTLSTAPASPQTSFHNRFYHASYRNPSSTSPSSSRANSPRYAPVGASRRLTATAAPPSPVPLPAQTPLTQSQTRSPRRETADAATQYTPPGFPPTFRRPFARQPGSESESTDPPRGPQLTKRNSDISPIQSPGEGSGSEPAATAEPLEPELRVEPQRPTASDVHRISIPNASSSRADNSIQESPSKRARPEEPKMKTLPLNYEACDVKDLGVLISDMLLELVRLNDLIPLKDGQLTRFHSRAPPAISVRDYLNRLIVHATLSPPILLSMVFYVDRLCALYPAFTISSLTVHRFLITAATVASKGLSDSFWTNVVYARVGGVSTKELALLEVEFLRRVEWRIVPKPEVLVDYYKGLVERGSGYKMEDEPWSDSESAVSSPMGEEGKPRTEA